MTEKTCSFCGGDCGQCGGPVEQPRIDFYATYRPPRYTAILSRFFTFAAVVIILACIVIGWRFGTYLHEHGIYLL